MRRTTFSESTFTFECSTSWKKIIFGLPSRFYHFHVMYLLVSFNLIHENAAYFPSFFLVKN